MFKNIIPVLIVFIIVGVGIGGIFYLSNQSQTTSANVFDPNQITLPTQGQTQPQNSAIISPKPSVAQATDGASMDNYITTQDGLKYLDETVGTGQEAKAGNTATVTYVGAFTDGKVFDASANHAETKNGFSFTIGAGQVIKGWDEGVAGMKVGGKRRLVVPPDLGYGSQDNGPIPGNSTLVFEVELLSVK